MIELDLIEDFIVFLKEKGKIEEAEEMTRAFNDVKSVLSEGIDLIEKDINLHNKVEKIINFKDLPKTSQGESISKKNKEVIMLDDCEFITCAILPNNNMHIVDIESEDIKDLLADMGHFRVHEKPIGKRETNSIYFNNQIKNKYLD